MTSHKQDGKGHHGLDGGGREEPVWHQFEAASALGIGGSILRAEVTTDEPAGATWLLSVYIQEESAVLTTGYEETVEQAKSAAWSELVDRRSRRES